LSWSDAMVAYCIFICVMPGKEHEWPRSFQGFNDL